MNINAEYWKLLYRFVHTTKTNGQCFGELAKRKAAAPMRNRIHENTMQRFFKKASKLIFPTQTYVMCQYSQSVTLEDNTGIVIIAV